LALVSLATKAAEGNLTGNNPKRPLHYCTISSEQRLIDQWPTTTTTGRRPRGKGPTDEQATPKTAVRSRRRHWRRSPRKSCGREEEEEIDISRTHGVGEYNYDNNVDDGQGENDESDFSGGYAPDDDEDTVHGGSSPVGSIDTSCDSSSCLLCRRVEVDHTFAVRQDTAVVLMELASVHVIHHMNSASLIAIEIS